MSQGILKLPCKLELQHIKELPCVEIQCRSPISQESHPVNEIAKIKLDILADGSGQSYSPTFVQRYLLIKLNNLAKYQGKEWDNFIQHLACFYSQHKSHHQKFSVKVCSSQAALLAQILLQSQTYKYLTKEMLDELLESSGIIAATMSQSYFKVRQFLGKSQFAVAMGLVSLHIRSSPFFPLVHEDKNHKGQIKFAAIMEQYINLDPSLQKPNLSMVQDAYSLRCTPQVHGVVYQCLSQLQQNLTQSINKPQFKQITVNNKKMRNLVHRSQTQTLILDTLVTAMNQIGHMSFLRTERILNQFLTKNDIAKKDYYELLMARLKKLSLFVAKNKLIAAPTNAQTVIMDNYKHDIFVDEGTPMAKVTAMICNITQILQLQLFCASSVLSDTYPQAPKLFKSQTIETVYEPLHKSHKNSSGHQQIAQQIDSWWRQDK